MRPDTLSILLALGLGGCNGCDTAPSAPPPPARDKPIEAPAEQGASAAPAERKTGVVHGVVKLADGAALPSFAPEQMEKRVLDHAKRGPWPADCTPPKQIDRQAVRQNDQGLLSGVLIAASEFTQKQERPQRVHELAIRDCRLEPRTVAAMVGDVVRVTNEVDYPFMPGYGNEPQLRTLTPGQTYDVKLDKPGVTPVLCGFTAPCGRSDVVVMMHPLSTVTGEDGTFRIEDFPAGESVKLSAWHPLFQEASVQVEIGDGEDKRVELVLTPAE